MPLDLDMYQIYNKMVVKTTITGIKPEDIYIPLTRDLLTIKGDHKEKQGVKEDDNFHKECRYGFLSSSVRINVSVKNNDADDADNVIILKYYHYLFYNFLMYYPI